MIRLQEAIARSKRMGVKILKKDLAARLWPESSEASQQIRMTALCQGKLKMIRPEWITIICDVCGCTADYLFGRAES